MTGESTERKRRVIRTTRMEAFSDGVFAIAITLLVLELSVPEGSSSDLFGAFLAQWPSYLAYVVSFATIGVTWLIHSVMTEYLDHVDATFVRLNLLLLLVVSFIPFPTRLLAEHISAEDAERIAVTIYGLTLLATAVVIAVLWRHARRSGLLRADVETWEANAVTGRLTPGFLAYAVIIGVGLVVPVVAVVGYLLVALFFLIPVRERTR